MPVRGEGQPRKGKGMTREAAYNQQKARAKSGAQAQARRAAERQGRSLPASTATAGPSSSSKSLQKTRAILDNPHPYRYKSFNDRLAAVHISPGHSLTSGRGSTLAGLDVQGVAPAQPAALQDEFDDDDEEARMALLQASTAFGSALATWRELNLSVPFQSLLRQIQWQSQSLPLLIHHREHIASSLSAALTSKTPDASLAYEPALDLFPRLALDLSSEFLPVYPAGLSSILSATTITKNATGGDEQMAARVVEKAFESMAALFRNMAALLSKDGGASDWLLVTWNIVKPYLGWREEELPQMDEGADGGDAAGVAEDEDGSDDDVDDDDDETPRPTAKKPTRIPPHVRRFAAEAFAHLLRRCKQSQLRRAAAFMLVDVESMRIRGTDGKATAALVSFASGVAGIWLEVVKSIDRRLHSQATAQLSALLTQPESVSASTTLVGTFVLTALVHHGQASHLAPLYELLLTWAAERMQEAEKTPSPASYRTLQQSIEWLVAAVGVRKGNRVDESVKEPLFTLLLRLADLLVSNPPGLPTELLTSSTTLFAIALPIGRIRDLVGPGIRIFGTLSKGVRGDHTLFPPFVATVLSLGDPSLAWSGFKQVALPQVLTATVASVSAGSASGDSAVLMLQKLAQLEQLESCADEQMPAVAKWRRAMADEIARRAARLADTINDAESATLLPALELVDLFASTPAAVKIAASLRRAIEALVAKPDALSSNDLTGPSNSAALLAAVSLSLAKLVDAADSQTRAQQFAEGVCSAQFFELAIDKLSSHPYALASILKLFKAVGRKSFASSTAYPLPEDVAPQLWTGLTSEEESLRHASTGWLALCSNGPKSEKHQDISEIYRSMHKIEAIPLRVETVRDRNVRLRALVREVLRLANTVAAESIEAGRIKVASKTVIRYVVGTLKLNFKPLWDECRKALADMAPLYGDEIWAVAFEELLHGKALQSPLHDVSAWQLPSVTDGGNLGVEKYLDDDNDKKFCDPQRLAKVTDIWRALQHAECPVQDQVVAELAHVQQPEGRLDVPSYRAQLLTLFSELPVLVEKHNAEFMPHFFSSVVEAATGDQGEHRDDADGATAHMTVKERQERLASYLKVFSKFSNPKALRRSDELHSFLYSIAAQGEPKLQRHALECVLTWKDPSQLPYEETLSRLLDQSKFRDELTSFDLAVDGRSIQGQHRKGLMPLLIRLLFGLAVSKKGRTSASTAGAGRKVAILNALSGCSSAELGILTDLMLAAFGDQRPTFAAADDGAMQLSTQGPAAFPRQQNGYLSLLADAVKHLGAQLLPHWKSLVGVTINLAHHSSLKAAEQGPGKSSAASRDVRQAAIRRLADFFRCPASDDFTWSPFSPAIFGSLVSPRLAAFASENTQSPSALLDLFSVWSTRRTTIPLFTQGDSTLLPCLYACLAAPTVKNAVVAPILDIIDRLLTVSEEPAEDEEAAAIKETVLRPYIPDLVSSLAPLLQRTSSAPRPDPLLQRQIQLLARVAAFVQRSEDATTILTLLGPMMRKSNLVVPEKSKTELLSTFRDLLLLTDAFKDPSSELFVRHYEMFSAMWSTLRSRSARVTLGEVFKQIALIDSELARVAQWVEGLNAYSQKRLDEYDFDRRLDVFDALTNEKSELSLSLREWQPLIHNMLFFIQDAEELVIRTNASAVLRRFVTAVEAEHDEEGPLRGVFTRTVYPVLRKTLRSRSELVRREVLSVIGTAAKQLADVGALSEMQGLLAGGDEEANFFNNIHHLQLHRRSRALRRLADHAQSGALRSKTISEVFLPLVGHFLEAGHTEIGDHNLSNETVTCMGRLSRQLKWGAYNSLLWKYLKLADGKGAGEKLFVRAAMAILDNFHFAMEDTIESEQAEEAEAAQVNGEEEAAPGVEGEAAAGGQGEPATDVADASRPQADTQRIVTSVTTKLLPALMGYLEHHDNETDDAIRLPIAVGVVRVVECLPAAEKEIHLAKLLNVLANVFRSKSQETRDLARETLCKIAVALGSERLPQVIKELRRALTRGPQLAILAYNVHSILVHLMQQEQDPLTYLDRGVDDIVQIASEDLFGHTGEDRESVEYKAKAREMRQSKSLDTFEQLSKIVAPYCFNSVLVPLKDVMEQTETPRAMKAVEDALRRTASGINSNDHFDYTSLLGLCHSLISRNATFLQARKDAAKNSKQAKKDMAVLLKRKDVEDGASKRDHYAVNAYRFVAFGLDLLVTALRRTRFDFSDADVLGRLDPLVGAVGNTLYAADTHVLSLGLRAAGGLLRCPLPSLEASLPVLVRQTFSIINREANPAADASQAGLRTLTIMLRDCSKAEFKEKQLAELLTLVLPEIEEPAAQSSIFGLVRAIIGRRFVVSEVYDVLDKVAEMMVTNQSSQVREISRAAFLQFLLDYPQGKGRLRNQMEFIAKNLSYVYESGRLSVMELLTAVLAKFSDDVLRDYGELLFVALVMVLANDDSTRCREKGAELCKALVGLVGEASRAKLVQMTHAWAENSDRPALARVGIQVYGLLLDGAGSEAETAGWMPKAMRITRQVVVDCAEDLAVLEEQRGDDDAMDLDVDALDWQLPYHALQTIARFSKVDAHLALGVSCASSTAAMTSSSKKEKDARFMWAAVRQILLFPHAWVRSASCRLLGALFATTAPAAPARFLPANVAGAEGSAESPLGATVPPLSLEALVDAARKLALQLRGEAVDDALSLQIVKNLLWIGKSFALVRVTQGGKPVAAKKASERAEEGDSDEGEGEGSDGDRDADSDSDSEAAADAPSAAAAPERDMAAGALENPLAWLFTKLSYQARDVQRAMPSGGSVVNTHGPTAILRLFAALAQHLPSERLVPLLPHVVHPLFRLMDDAALSGGGGAGGGGGRSGAAATAAARMEALRSLAAEVQDLISEKVSPTVYASVYARVRARTLEKRRQRKTKRLMGGLVDAPEVVARRREKRNEARHESRKRKNRAYADGKMRVKPLKRHRG